MGKDQIPDFDVLHVVVNVSVSAHVGIGKLKFVGALRNHQNA